jgi:hypothetical protein
MHARNGTGEQTSKNRNLDVLSALLVPIPLSAFTGTEQGNQLGKVITKSEPPIPIRVHFEAPPIVQGDSLSGKPGTEQGQGTGNGFNVGTFRPLHSRGREGTQWEASRKARAPTPIGETDREDSLRAKRESKIQAQAFPPFLKRIFRPVMGFNTGTGNRKGERTRKKWNLSKVPPVVLGEAPETRRPKRKAGTT